MANTPWHCPDHPASPVTRSGDRSRCHECGQTNHPMDLPGVDRVLVICGDCNEFMDEMWRHGPDRGRVDWVMFGGTEYRYVSSIQQVRGHVRESTRHLVLNRRRYNPEIGSELIRRYAPAPFPEARQAPEPGVIYRNCTFNGEPLNSEPEPDNGRIESVMWAEHYFRFQGIGNPACRFNARSRYLRCAVRPEAGSCEGCSDFELRGEGDEL